MVEANREPGYGAAIDVRPVTPQNRDLFIEWAQAHGAEHDDSYTQPPDLKLFPGPGEVAALALSEERPIGAASLMVDGYVESGLARFRILHAVQSAAYGPLVRWILARVPAGVRHAFLFLPDGAPASEAVAGLGFAPTRYAVILERGPAAVPEADAPAGVQLRTAAPADAAAWAAVANAAFAGDPGRFEMTPERAAELLGDERVLASFLAWAGTAPIGLVTVWRDDQEGAASAEVATLAVVPHAQGRGLGRALLRRGLQSAVQAGFSSASLSTSSVNRAALGLYTSEGFRVVETRVCWGRDLAGAAGQDGSAPGTGRAATAGS